jgi:V8-like Glu-specific endopeptidase
MPDAYFRTHSRATSLKQYSSLLESFLFRALPIRDGRNLVDDTATWPYSVQGRIVSEYCIGSGTMIGPQVVLTCAHNIWVRECMQEVDKESMKFYPAKNGNEQPFAEARILEVYYPEEYKSGKVGLMNGVTFFLEHDNTS